MQGPRLGVPYTVLIRTLCSYPSNTTLRLRLRLGLGLDEARRGEARRGLALHHFTTRNNQGLGEGSSKLGPRLNPAWLCSARTGSAEPVGLPSLSWWFSGA